MNIFWSILLGILQGLTEFLPVSSSGHLVLAQNLIPGFSQPGVLFDVVLHAGTLFAVIFYFREKILNIGKKDLVLLAVATIPAAVFGFFLQDYIETLFLITKLVGLALLVTAAMNYLTDKVNPKQQKINIKNAAAIGIAQALAIIPGISRSGATIFAGSTLGIKKKKAAEFSFLLSIPAVFGANVLQFAKHGLNSGLDQSFYIVGFLSAFISGYVAIGAVFKLLQKKRFTYFAFYCAVIGVLALLS